jgi:hypothetical protein
VFRAFMPQVLAVVLAEEHAGRLREARLANVLRVRPAGRAVGRDQARLPRAPDRHADGDQHGDKPLPPAMAPPMSNTRGA